MARMRIEAELRTQAGTGAARRLRRQGKIPGIVYGSGTANLMVQVNANLLEKVLASGATGLVDLVVNGESHVVLIQEVQRSPDRGALLHVDFHRVRLDEEVEARVPVVIVGEEQRPPDGGVVVPFVREITVSCLPANLPERIEVDVSKLSVGQSLTVADLVAPPGVTIKEPREEVVVSVVMAEAEEESAEEKGEGESK